MGNPQGIIWGCGKQQQTHGCLTQWESHPQDEAQGSMEGSVTEGQPTSPLPSCSNPLPPRYSPALDLYRAPPQSPFQDISQHPQCPAPPPGRRSPGATKCHHEKSPAATGHPATFCPTTTSLAPTATFPSPWPGPGCVTQLGGTHTAGAGRPALDRVAALFFRA